MSTATQANAVPQKKKSRLVPVLCGIFGTTLALYVGFAAWLRIDGRFPFRTTLNGQDVSLRRALDVQRTCMDAYYPNMYFSVESRGNPPYRVTPSSFDFSDAERAVSFLPDSMLLWPRSLFEDTCLYTMDGDAIQKLAQRIEADSGAFRADLWETPQDAYVVYDEAGGKFSIVPDTAGSAIDKEKFEAALEQHVRYGRGDLDLSAAGVYRHADVVSTSPQLAEENDRLNRFLSAEVVYTVGEESLSFYARDLLSYVDARLGPSAIRYNARAAADDGVFDAFAQELAAAFDSKGGASDFITNDGETVSVTQKTWRATLDHEATAEALAALSFDDLSRGGKIEGTLVWEKAPLDALTNYVEVDLTNQQLYLYTDGEQVLDSPIVSGCVAQRHSTPSGAFSLIGKSRNVVLRGEDYANFVNFWMPFNKNIGLHDAPWRRRFGGTIYKANGSHGCINLPYDVAETLFNTIDDSYAIVCYWRPAEQK